MRKFFLFLAMVLSCPSAFALDSFCYQLADYQEKMQCVDAYVQTLKKTDSKETLKSHANIQALVGFFAYIFKHYPEKKAKLLEVDPPQHVKSVYVESLYRAGLPEEAKNYARTNGFDYLIKHFSAKPAAKVDIAIPQIPSDNDLLIGAYMASGDKNYIAHLFEPLKQVDDGMAKDAIRMGFLQKKFGPTLAPKGREPRLIKALNEKYRFEADMSRLVRIATLASAIWATQSLGERDGGVKEGIKDFFTKDKRLGKIYETELVEFSNYLTMLVMFETVKDTPDDKSAKIEQLLIDYEESRVMDLKDFMKDGSN